MSTGRLVRDRDRIGRDDVRHVAGGPCGDAHVAAVRLSAAGVLHRVRLVDAEVRAGRCPADRDILDLASDIVRLDDQVVRAMRAPRSADLPAVELARVQVATARRIVRELLAEVRPA